MPQSPQPIVEHLADVFQERFSRSPEAAGISPGRVEILGNHTDYSGGCVLAATIDRYIVAIGARRTDDTIRAYAAAFDGETSLDANMLAHTPQHGWPDYLAAAIVAANRAADAAAASDHQQRRNVPGMDIVIGGDLPMAAGLSSSAALEAAVARLLLYIAKINVASERLAAFLQESESRCAGVRCGLLDQFTVLCGAQNKVLVFDSEAGAANEQMNCPDQLAFLLINPHIARELGGDAPYNQRREECEAAAALLAEHLGRPAQALCRTSLDDYRRARRALPTLLQSRSRHVVMEHQRVLRAVGALGIGDLARFGRLLNASHRSSSLLFENSHAMLDSLQRLTVGAPGCLGCRITGGGWGGCLLAAVRSEEAADFADRLRTALAGTGISPCIEVFRCDTAAAAHGTALQ